MRPLEGAGRQRRDSFSDAVLSRSGDVNLSHGDDASLPAGDPRFGFAGWLNRVKQVVIDYFRPPE